MYLFVFHLFSIAGFVISFYIQNNCKLEAIIGPFIRAYGFSVSEVKGNQGIDYIMSLVKKALLLIAFHLGVCTYIGLGRLNSISSIYLVGKVPPTILYYMTSSTMWLLHHLCSEGQPSKTKWKVWWVHEWVGYRRRPAPHKQLDFLFHFTAETPQKRVFIWMNKQHKEICRTTS